MRIIRIRIKITEDRKQAMFTEKWDIRTSLAKSDTYKK